MKMIKHIINGIFLFPLLSSCSISRQDLPIMSCSTPEQMNANYSKAVDLQQAMQSLVNTGVPGFSMAVYSKEGWWTASAGFSKIEDRTAMQSCHLQYLQSIAKTYMAVGILKMYEQGKIDLDAPMTRYLPEKYSRYIMGAEKVSVRMLLNHTSGIPEYNSAPAYVTRLLQHPDYAFTPEEYLQYIEGKPLSFAPGSRYSYRNTNYLLLALIADALTGDHAKFIAENIFTPAGLSHTFYRNHPGYLNYPNLTNAYWDRYSNGILENASQMQRNNVAALIGDDGIVATPVDAVKFLKGLMEAKLFTPETLEIMKTWVKDKEGNPNYGLGLDHAIFRGQPAYGHSGGGIGAGCQLYYFPGKNLYVFLGINLGTVTESPIHEAAEKRLDEIYGILLK